MFMFRYVVEILILFPWDTYLEMAVVDYVVVVFSILGGSPQYFPY